MKFFRTPTRTRSSRPPTDPFVEMRPDSRATGPGGWHESSLELSRGLEVSEMLDTLPADLFELPTQPAALR